MPHALMDSKYYIFYILFFFTTFSYSQIVDLEFSHLGKKEGLINDNFNSFVTKDSEGFVWISSMKGCYRFDGQNLKHYNVSDKGGSGEIIQSSFFEDTNKDLWFTTYDALHRYNRRTDDFESFYLQIDSILIKTDYHAFYFKDNNLWLKAGEYIWRFNTSDKNYQIQFQDKLGKRFVVKENNSGKVVSIFSFPWIMKPGFAIWEKTHDSWESEYFNSENLENAEFSNGLIENDSIIWLISDKGIIEFDCHKKVQKRLLSPENANSSSTLNDGIFIREKLILLSYKDIGLWSFNTDKKEFEYNWNTANSDGHNLIADNPAELYLDSDNMLWVTQESGLDYSEIIFKTYTNPLKGFFPDWEGVIKNIVEDEEYRVWVLDVKNGIYVFNTNNQLIHHFKEIKGFSDFSRAHLSIDQDNNLWLILENNVFNLNANSDRIDNWNLILAGNEPQKFYSLFHGISGKVILIDLRGVFEVIVEKDDVALSRVNSFTEYSNYEFRYFFKVNSNTLFVPFLGEQVFSYNIIGGSLFFQDTVEINAEIFNSCISYDYSNTWIATGDGVVEMDINQNKSLIIDNAAFGNNCSVYSILEDQKNRLWLATDCGIWYYNLDSKELVRYILTDELPSSRFFHGTCLTANNGDFWFENEEGLVVFNPDSINILKPSGSAFINNFWINNKEDKRIHSIVDSNVLKLNYSENKLDFQFGVLGLGDYSNASVQYRLRNYNDNWQNAMNGEVIHFPNLSPNDYKLELIPVDKYNQKGQLKSVEIIISPPFWTTTWFRIGGLFLFTILIGFSFRVYYQSKIRKQQRLLEKQRAINKERDRIAKELHDDIGGGLSTILFISKDLHLEGTDDFKAEQTDRISVLAKDALNNMRDVIWVLDDQLNTLNDLLAKIKTYSTNALTDNKFAFGFESDINTTASILLSGEIKRNILLIVKECLHNIIKHSKATRVDISIMEKDRRLQILILDDGQGFNTQKPVSKGYGIGNIKTRCKAINGDLKIESSEKSGTAIAIEIDLEP